MYTPAVGASPNHNRRKGRSKQKRISAGARKEKEKLAKKSIQDTHESTLKSNPGAMLRSSDKNLRKLPCVVASTTSMRTVDQDGSDAAGDERSSGKDQHARQSIHETRSESIRVGAGIEGWCRQILIKGPEAIANEYKPAETSLPEAQIKTFKENDAFNRYRNTFCTEKSRVKVANGQPNDYIHANYVAYLEEKPKHFIAAQAPMDNTVDQFWRMIMGEKITTIVMLCDIIEKGVSKCTPYFPMELNQSLKFGDIVIKCCGKSMLNGTSPINVEITLLDAKDESAGGSWLSIRHYHWLAWEDHGVPAGYTAPIRILHASHVKHSKSPVLVHCSAGVGRTGTIILISAAKQLLSKGCEVNLMQLLQKLREQRPMSVQNELQYLYVHRVLLDYFMSKGLLMDKDAFAKFNKDYEGYITATKKKRRVKKKDPTKEESSNDNR